MYSFFSLFSLSLSLSRARTKSSRSSLSLRRPVFTSHSRPMQDPQPSTAAVCLCGRRRVVGQRKVVDNGKIPGRPIVAQAPRWVLAPRAEGLHHAGGLLRGQDPRLAAASAARRLHDRVHEVPTEVKDHGVLPGFGMGAQDGVKQGIVTAINDVVRERERQIDRE